ncbi:MAG: hypothetical protein RID81_09895 [Sandaracinaceae bacterium]
MSAAEKTPKKTPPPIPRGTFSDVVPVSRRERVEGPVDVPKPPPLPTGLASSAPPPMPPKAATLPPAIPFLRVPKPVRMVTDEPFASERTPIPDELDTVPEALAPEEETFVRRVPALDTLGLDADLDAEPSTLDLDTTLDLDEELDALDPRGFVADAPAADAAEALSEVDEDAETLDLGSSDRVDLDDLVDPLGGPRASLAPTLSPPPLVSPQGEERDRRGVVFAWSLAVLALVAGFGVTAWWVGARSAERVSAPVATAPSPAPVASELESAEPATVEPATVEPATVEPSVEPALDTVVVEPVVLEAEPVAEPPRRVRATPRASAASPPAASPSAPSQTVEARPAPEPVAARAPAPRPASADLHALPTRAEIQAAMESARPSIQQCGSPATSGYVANIRFTFVSSGRPTHAVVEGVSGQTASCIARAARAVRVPPFANDRMTVQFPFSL